MTRSSHAANPRGRVGSKAAEGSREITAASPEARGQTPVAVMFTGKGFRRNLKAGECTFLTFSKIVRPLSLPASEPR